MTMSASGHSCGHDGSFAAELGCPRYVRPWPDRCRDEASASRARISLPQFRNIYTLGTLAKSRRGIKAACHNFRAEHRTKSARRLSADQSAGSPVRNFLNSRRATCRRPRSRVMALERLGIARVSEDGGWRGVVSGRSTAFRSAASAPFDTDRCAYQRSQRLHDRPKALDDLSGT
jgi:hypothetical protein